MRRWLTLAFALLWSLVAVLPAQAANNFPLPPAPQQQIYVQDLAGILQSSTRQAILQAGAQLDEQTGAQAVVVTVPSLEGRSIEEYANALFREWGIGQKGKDNGVLLLVAPNEKKSRIEVGHGLEGPLPDGLTGRIQDEYVIPNFRAGDYDAGVWQGYQAIIGQVAKEYNVDLHIQNSGENYQSAYPQQEKASLPWWIPLLLVVFLIVDFFFFRGFITRTLLDIFLWSMIFRGGRGGGGGGGFGGGFGGGSSGGGGSSRDW